MQSPFLWRSWPNSTKLNIGKFCLGGGYTSIAKTCDYLAIQRILGYKVLAYIGNFTENKNQIELVRLMLALEKEKIIAILVGREMDRGQVRRYAEKHRLENVVLAGFCSEMDSIWINTDLNVLLSKNDGFGLSIIEGYMRGVPSIMYDDLDAVEDIRDIDLHVIRRNSDALYKALVEIKRKEDIRYLMLRALRYSIDQMRNNYLVVYKKSVERS